VLWEFCLRHPEVRDVCDIGQMLFWNQRWAWWATAVMFILNNTVSPSSIPSFRVSPANMLPCSSFKSVHMARAVPRDEHLLTALPSRVCTYWSALSISTQ
jgi:hypothetical protein